MSERRLPPPDEMYRTIVARDARYDGIFFTAVTTTGIFCRPSCPARKPERRNVEFYRSASEALARGFRPCKRCRPLELRGHVPEPIRTLLAEMEQNPAHRIRDRDLRERGLDPTMLRRWFNEHHGMTFQAYQRARRLSKALGELAGGAPITHAAFGNGYESLSGFQDALRRITGRSASRSRDAALVYLSRVPTPLGPMLMGTTAEGVCLLEFADRPLLETQLRRLVRRLDCAFVPGSTEAGRRLESELQEYFAGTRYGFGAPLLTPGTEFQRRVWTALRAVPAGRSVTYAELARAVGAPAAVRAVARANRDNPIAVVVPCHRVIGAGGGLTGYGGGLWRKSWLLHHEGAARAEGGRRAD